MSKLSGKIAVVSGGTGALGRVVVEKFLIEDAIVITTHTGNDASIAYVSEKKKHYPKIEGKVVDVTSERSVNGFYIDVLSKYSRVDILCNLVGGVNQKKVIEDNTVEEWNAMLTLNLQSCFLMMRNAIRSMKENNYGRIINIASMPAVTPEAKRGGYGVAKAGVVALTKTAAEEVKQSGDITVNAIAPSIILTDENKSWGTEADFKKWVTPEQIANMIVHLCTDSGKAINGHVIQMYGKV